MQDPPCIATALLQLARAFSPRVETYGDRVVSLDVSGLGSLFGEVRAIGDALRTAAADAGLRIHIAIAATSVTARLMAQARAGLTIVPAGAEAATLAPLPLRTLSGLQAWVPCAAAAHGAPSGSRPQARPSPKPEARSPEPSFEHLHRWGLRTLGDLAAIPSADLAARLGQDGLRWQRWARGEDARPLVPAGVEEPFEASLDLEWPIDGLEPLSFVLARLFEPLCERLERDDRGAVVLHVTLTLVTREVHVRSLQLPAPMRDAKVLRTLALLDLESHPPGAAIDRVSVGVEVTEGRVLQFGLFARALPAETVATLVARLGALMGSDRVGAPALVDSYRPGAFAMGSFTGSGPKEGSGLRAQGSGAQSRIPNPQSLVRRFRMPVPARVTLDQGRPARLTTDRRGLSGGRVERCEGPWRSSGDWWMTGPGRHRPWDCDEWDVSLADGATYRISQTRTGNHAWFVDGVLD